MYTAREPKRAFPSELEHHHVRAVSVNLNRWADRVLALTFLCFFLEDSDPCRGEQYAFLMLIVGCIRASYSFGRPDIWASSRTTADLCLYGGPKSEERLQKGISRTIILDSDLA
jgi:hypothetical protein